MLLKINYHIARSIFRSENAIILLIAFLLFSFNQIFEFSLIRFFKSDYSALCNLDCDWYVSIVEHGYDKQPYAHPKMDAANWAFFPFFPFLTRLTSYVADTSSQYSLIVTGKALFFLSIFTFIKMAKEYESSVPYITYGAIVAFNPYAIYGNVGYTEPAFLLLTTSFLYYLKREKFIAAALVGSILTSVRLVGLFSIFSYLFYGRSKINNGGYDRKLYVLGLLIIPIGFSLFVLYLYFLTGDALAFSHIQRAWGRNPSNPFIILIDGFQGGWLSKYWAAVSFLALFSVVILAYKKFYDLAIFSLFCTIIPLSTGLWAMPRYIFWQAPILFLIAYLSYKNKIWVVLLVLFTVIQMVMYNGWFLSKAWTI